MESMDLSRHISVFNPENLVDPVHVIGVGATGSFLVMMLVRMGVKEINIYDFDSVEKHNIPNQYYDEDDIGKSKVQALKDKLLKINPNVKINTFEERVYAIATEENKIGIDKMSGYVFSLVDSMKTRKELFEAIKANENIIHYWESRLGSDQARVYCLPIDKDFDYSTYENLHFYSDENSEVSACGTSITVLPIVMSTASLMISQFINVVMKNIEPINNHYTLFDNMYNSYFENFNKPTVVTSAIVESEILL